MADQVKVDQGQTWLWVVYGLGWVAFALFCYYAPVRAEFLFIAVGVGFINGLIVVLIGERGYGLCRPLWIATTGQNVYHLAGYCGRRIYGEELYQQYRSTFEMQFLMLESLILVTIALAHLLFKRARNKTAPTVSE